MSESGAGAVLPAVFLRTALAACGPDTPVVRLAMRRVQDASSPHSDRADLVEALLSGPYASEAPSKLLHSAVQLETEAPAGPYEHYISLPLTSLALNHPSCTASLRDETLQRCTPAQLATLGTPDCDAHLATKIAQTLRALDDVPPPMTPDLLENPTPAQIVLRQIPLHDLVFEAARDMLPTVPDTGEPSSAFDEEWMDRNRRAHDAWDRMWRQVLKQHPHRHRQLVQRADATHTQRTVRNRLLGDLPWMVEPQLLAELAATDLERFSFEILRARGCRKRRDGAEAQQVLESMKADLAPLDEDEQDSLRHFVESESTTLLDLGCRGPILWMEHAAAGTWRHLLNPEQAKEEYRQVAWRTPAPALEDLAALFAQAAARALPFWEPEDRYSTVRPSQVIWVREMLLHLPTVTEEVKAGVRPIARHLRNQLNSRHPTLRLRYDEAQDIEKAVQTIERVLADPPLAVGPDRSRTALGAPDTVTVRGLSSISAQSLGEYLDRHPGDDTLVEKALLATAAGSNWSDSDFDNVCAGTAAPTPYS